MLQINEYEALIKKVELIYTITSCLQDEEALKLADSKALLLLNSL